MGIIEDFGWDQWSFTLNDVFGLILVYGIIIISFAAYTIAKKHWTLVDPRKIIHIGVGQFIWVWWLFSSPWVMTIFFTLPFTLILFLAMFDNNPIGRSKIGTICRQGHKTGLFFYALAIFAAVLLCFNHWLAATVAIVAMTIGDGMGSVIGKKFGKHKIINGKSLEGTLAVFAFTAIFTAAIILFYTFLIQEGYVGRAIPIDLIIPWYAVAIIIGAEAAIVECVSGGDYDNFIVEFCTAVTMILLGG